MEVVYVPSVPVPVAESRHSISLLYPSAPYPAESRDNAEPSVSISRFQKGNDEETYATSGRRIGIQVGRERVPIGYSSE